MINIQVCDLLNNWGKKPVGITLYVCLSVTVSWVVLNIKLSDFYKVVDYLKKMLIDFGVMRLVVKVTTKLEHSISNFTVLSLWPNKLKNFQHRLSILYIKGGWWLKKDMYRFYVSLSKVKVTANLHFKFHTHFDIISFFNIQFSYTLR